MTRVERGAGRAIVTTNFRPYEAIILHLAVQAQADIPVLWVDHGTNLPETYQFAEKCHQPIAGVIINVGHGMSGW